MYQITLSNGYCFVYRAGTLLAQGRGSSDQQALSEALRNARMARHSGACK